MAGQVGKTVRIKSDQQRKLAILALENEATIQLLVDLAVEQFMTRTESDPASLPANRLRVLRDRG